MTSDDDELLIHLKEKTDLFWEQIADFFPGRDSGTLQVRYCSRLRVREEAPLNEVQKREFRERYMRKKWNRYGSGLL